MQLTEHFSDAELGVAGCEARIIDNATALSIYILEPLRAEFGPVAVDDGYRDPGHNARAGGKGASQHLYEGGDSAADVRTIQAPIVKAFDWIRLESGLPFDQAILEYSGADEAAVEKAIAAGVSFLEAIAEQPEAYAACIHLSYNLGTKEQQAKGIKPVQRRQALYGFTGSGHLYVPAEVR